MVCGGVLRIPFGSVPRCVPNYNNNGYNHRSANNECYWICEAMAAWVIVKHGIIVCIRVPIVPLHTIGHDGVRLDESSEGRVVPTGIVEHQPCSAPAAKIPLPAPTTIRSDYRTIQLSDYPTPHYHSPAYSTIYGFVIRSMCARLSSTSCLRCRLSCATHDANISPAVIVRNGVV